MAKYSINLLQPELQPETPTWTLGRVASLWLITLVLMLAWLSWTTIQVNDTKRQVAQSTQKKNELKSRQASLEIKVAANKADQALVEQLETIKLLLDNKRFLHKQLTDTTKMYAAGFSQAMSELSLLDHRDVSLQRIQIQGDYIGFTGLAKTPESVPSWLAAFEQSTFLSGHEFSHFQLKESKEQLIEFVVSTQLHDGNR